MRSVFAFAALNLASAVLPDDESVELIANRGACLAAVRRFRPDMTLCESQYSNKADQQAYYDSTHGAHAYLRTYGWGGVCHGSSTGQCECPNWGSERDQACFQAYYNEGPGGGHYDIMMNPKSKCVACGYNSGSMTHNFCTQWPPANCGDKKPQWMCNSFKSKGYCSQSSQYYGFMTNACAGTCGFCGGAADLSTNLSEPFFVPGELDTNDMYAIPTEPVAMIEETPAQELEGKLHFDTNPMWYSVPGFIVGSGLAGLIAMAVKKKRSPESYQAMPAIA